MLAGKTSITVSKKSRYNEEGTMDKDQDEIKKLKHEAVYEEQRREELLSALRQLASAVKKRNQAEKTLNKFNDRVLILLEGYGGL